MSNEAQKQKLVLQIRSRDPWAGILIREAEKYEKRFGKDLSQFDGMEVSVFLEAVSGAKEFPKHHALDILRNYNKVCEDAGLPVSKDWKGIEPGQVDECLSVLYAGPLHLAAEMDRVFSPVSEGDADLLYRCYLWLAYAEAPNNLIWLLRRNDVDLLRRRVTINGESYRIYEEAAGLFAMVKDMAGFKVSVTKGEAYVERRHPELFFSFMERGEYSPEGKQRNMKIRLSMLSRQTGASLSYSAVRTSGMFYRIFELERSMRISSPADEFVYFETRGLAGKNGDKGRADWRTRKLMNERYAAWKKAFSV